MINRYASISEKQFNLYTPPLDVIGSALETAQKTYDRNFMFANEIKNKYINALPQDRARANELQGQWEKQVDDVVKTFNGDYSKGSKDLYLLQKDIEKQYRQGGEAYAIEYNHGQLQDSMKRNKERLAKGDIVQGQYEALYSHFDNNYQGVKKQEDGTWSVANIPELASYVDTYKLADEATKNLKPRTRKETVVTKGKDGYLRYDTREVSGIDEQEVRDAISGSIMSDTKYLNYATQLAQLRGEDPQKWVGQEIESTYNALGPTRSGIFTNTSDVKLEADKFALEKMRYQHDLGLEAFKDANRYKLAAAKGEIETQGGAPNMRMIATVQQENSKYRPIDEQTGIKTPTKYLGQTALGKAILSPTLTAGLYGMPVPFSSSKGSVDDVLKSPSDYGTINVPLMKAIKDKNPKYTDQQVIQEYNRSLPKQNTGESVFIDAYRNSDTGEEATRLMAPYLKAGTSRAFFVDARGDIQEMQPQQQKDAYSKVWDEEKNKPLVPSIGNSMTFNGKVPMGEVFPVDGGYMILSSNNEVINQYNTKLRPAAFDFIGENRIAGDPFEIGIAGRGSVNVQGVKVPSTDPKRQRDEQGLPVTTFDIRYMQLDDKGNVKMVKNKRGEMVPDYFTIDDQLPDGTTETRYANPYDMETTLAGWLRGADRPHNIKSKSKDYNTSYE